MKKVRKTQPVLALKPTQFSVGVLEVEFKVHELRKMKKNKRAEYVRSKPIPVVISPWEELCVIDHHHFLFACWHANINEVQVEVVKDYSNSQLTYLKFWKKLLRLRYAYLFDQFGEGERHPLYLPDDVRGMADDPYRSLAWIVRKEGGFDNSDVTFAEFQWANFFREHKLLDSQGRRGMQKAVPRAIRLAHSKKASGLPGFIKKENKKKQVVENMPKKSKFIPKQKVKGPMATVPKIEST